VLTDQTNLQFSVFAMPRLSVIIITRNEEQDLPRCLRSVQWADQIVVVDSHSTDRTVEIAREQGAEVYVEDWKGYTDQKNSALDKATGDWVFSIDADEELSERARMDIRVLLAQDNGVTHGYAFRRKVFYLGKWIHHGDWYPDYVTRLWRRGKGRFAGRRVHESVVVDGRVESRACDILHYTYRDLDDQKARIQKYARLWADDQFEKGRRVSWLDVLVRPIARFLRALVLKNGWCDGWRGWLIAWLSAGEVLLKYQHLLALQRETFPADHPTEKNT
jgi:hypothetical protein